MNVLCKVVIKKESLQVQDSFHFTSVQELYLSTKDVSHVICCYFPVDRRICYNLGHGDYHARIAKTKIVPVLKSKFSFRIEFIPSKIPSFSSTFVVENSHKCLLAVMPSDPPGCVSIYSFENATSNF